jgi:AraC family transcriptional regulator
MSTALRIVHGDFGRVALLDMDRSLVRHAHPHCHVLIKVEGADTQFAVGEQLVQLTDRQAVLVNAWKPHAYVHDEARARTIILALYIEPGWLNRFRSNWGANSASAFGANAAGEISPRIRALAMDLAQAMLADPASRSAHERLISDLMISTIERFTPWRSAAEQIRFDRQTIDWRIRRVIDLMRADPGQPHDVDALARAAGLSRAHFFRLFESSTKVTPHVYLNVLRLELSVNAIVHDDAALAPLSRQLGFSTPGHFTRFFRDHSGVNPSEFRTVARMGTLVHN